MRLRDSSWTFGLLLLMAAALFSAKSLAENAFVDRGEGKDLILDLLNRVPPENEQVLGLLKIRSPEGSMTEVPMKWVVRILQKGFEDTYEAQPVGNQPGEVLMIRHHGTEPSEYYYGLFAHRGDKVNLRKVEGAQLFQSFGHSDFYLGDLGLDFFHWPSQKIVKKEMRKSRSCRVVESLNPNPVPGTYSRVLSWLDFETGNLIMAEAYDLNNRLLKEFSIRKISRNEGQAQLKEIEMRNDQTDSRTRLEFNLNVPETNSGQ